jgi:hypothetical protein
MRRLMVLLMVLTVQLGLCCAPAEANWWDAIEALSGPGPFSGRGNVMTTICPPLGGNRAGPSHILSRPADLPESVPCFFLDFRNFKAEEDDRFPEVSAKVVEFGFSFQLRRALEMGSGVGWIRFKSASRLGGTDVTTDRMTLTPLRVVVKPLLALPYFRQHSRWGSVLKYYVRESVLIGRLTGEDFGVQRGVFNTEHEFVTSAGFIIDVGELLGY